MKSRALALAACLGLLVGCQSITISPEGHDKLDSEPTYSETEHFYFWGLAGTGNVDVASVCENSKVTQMQAKNTSVDNLLGLITIGIYSPRHAMVWCE